LQNTSRKKQLIKKATEMTLDIFLKFP